MRLYLSADIEGTCGIADWAETERATMDDYRPFAAQMTAEVAAACEGAVAAGAEDILVKDAHDSARNLDAARLPRQARVLRGWTGDPLCMMAGLERGAFGGVLFTATTPGLLRRQPPVPHHDHRLRPGDAQRRPGQRIPHQRLYRPVLRRAGGLPVRRPGAVRVCPGLGCPAWWPCR